MDNKIYETIKMTPRFNHLTQKKNGLLELSKLPIPGSITVYLQGQLIEPESFDEYGNPILSIEMTEYFTTRHQLLCRNNPEDNTSEDIYARVSYEVMDFTAPQDEFDSVRGIQKSLDSLEAFNKMLTNRRCYLKAFGDKASLSEYIVWGRYILDKAGKIHDWSGTIKNTSTNTLKTAQFLEEIRKLPDVCQISILSSFLQKDEIVCYGPSIYVPKTDAICPICGRKISMYDLRVREFSTLNGKSCHRNCFYDYEEQLSIGRITSLIDEIYDEKIKYKITERNISSITLLFETPDGGIEIQDTLGLVAIEWKENYKPFDIAIFNNEKELKWCSINGEVKILDINIPKNFYTHHNRGIMARHDYENAERYLRIVKETVSETK